MIDYPCLPCSLALMQARSRRSTESVYEMKKRIETLLDFSDTETASIVAAGNKEKQAIQNAASSINTAADAVIAASGTQLDTRVSRISTVVASAQATFNSFSSSVASTTSSLTAQVTQETVARSTAFAQLSSSYAALDTAASSTIAASVSDRAALRGARAADTILATVTAQINAAVSTENSRGVVETTTQSTSVASIRPSFSTLTKTAITTEASRADAACLSTATVSTSFSLAAKDGSLDHTAWYVYISCIQKKSRFACLFHPCIMFVVV
jgi:hypothetical protein